MTWPAAGPARAWMAQDPDPVTRSELDALVAAAEAGDAPAAADLAERFGGRLEFGTAGLRGELGAGPMRMNRVLVAQAAAGLAAYLLSRAPHPSVVVGYDGRHNSSVFARDTAELMQGAGVQVALLPRALPTPVLAFAVRHLDASAGVMVTASHNPARDNGYKVYLGGIDRGSQIVPPADAGIAAEIARVASGSITVLPRSAEVRHGARERRHRVRAADRGAVDVVVRPEGRLHRDARRRMGDRGRRVRRGRIRRRRSRSTRSCGPIRTSRPSPSPTPRSRARSTSRSRSPRRRAPTSSSRTTRTPTGSPWGCPTAAHPAAGGVSAATRSAGCSAGRQRGDWMRTADEHASTLACSLVSSPALGAIARHHRLDFVETLTGFKWISRVGGLAFGYEEALGYLVDPDKVRDKDGISAAVRVIDLFTELAASGTTLDQHLIEFAETFGGYASSQISIRVSDLAQIARTMSRLRAELPARIGGMRVDRIDDFREGFDAFPPSDLLRFHLEGGARVIVRPSGTEPKLKCYLDTVSEEGSGAERLAAAGAALAQLEAGMRALLEA